MYKRILLKLSGEALADKTLNQTLNCEKIKDLTCVIKSLHEKGVEIAIVVGAGNIWRGKFASTLHIDPADADYMGMLGTIINATALSDAFKSVGIPSKVFSPIHISPITNIFDEKEVNASLTKKEVVVFGGGTGKPFFTTDTAATLRAIQINADVILVAKNGVDGVYSSDPKIDKNAFKYDILTFEEILDKKLQVMDLSAIDLIKDKDIELKVFDMGDVTNIEKVCLGQDIGTTVKRG